MKHLRYLIGPKSTNSSADVDFTLLKRDSEVAAMRNDPQSQSTIFWTGNDLRSTIIKHAQNVFAKDSSVLDIHAVLIIRESWDIIPNQNLLLSNLRHPTKSSPLNLVFINALTFFRDCLNVQSEAVVRVSITPVFNEDDANVLIKFRDFSKLQNVRRTFCAKFLQYSSEVRYYCKSTWT